MQEIWLKIVGVVGAVFLFGFAVFIHELGHFIVAKLAGVGVSKFSIGFGPIIWKLRFQYKETEYSIRWFPLGGFVALKGMGEDETESKEAESDESPPGSEKSESATEDLDALRHRHPMVRIAVFAAGVTCNYLTAIVIMAFMLWHGLPEYKDLPNRLESVPEKSRIYELGWRSGDRIVAVDGQGVKTWEDFESNWVAAQEARGAGIGRANKDALTTLTAVVVRGDERLSLPVPPDWISDSNIFSPPRPPYVGAVEPSSPADKTRLVEDPYQPVDSNRGLPTWEDMKPFPIRSGDRVVQINGEPVNTWREMTQRLQSMPDEPITLVVRRGGEDGHLIRLATVLERKPENPEKGQIGIHYSPEPTGRRIQGESLGKAISIAPIRTIQITRRLVGMTVRFIAESPWSQTRRNLGGPMAIGHLAYQSAQQGLAMYLNVFMTISVMLAVINLLPIPILDGGYIMITLVEAIIRRPIPQRILEPILKTFAIMFLMLFVLLFYNDFMNLILKP